MASVTVQRRVTFTVVSDTVFDDRRLSKSDLMVYWALARHADKAGKCRPSYTRISEMARVSRKTAIESIKTLEKLGYLEKEQQASGVYKSSFATNRYNLTDYTTVNHTNGVNHGNNNGKSGVMATPGGGVNQNHELEEIDVLDNSSSSRKNLDTRKLADGEKSLFVQAQEAFLSKNPPTTYVFAKEGPHLKDLILKAETECPEDPRAWLKKLCETAWKMRGQKVFPMYDEKRHIAKPFLPSFINAKGNYPFIIERMMRNGSRSELKMEIPY